MTDDHRTLDRMTGDPLPRPGDSESGRTLRRDPGRDGTEGSSPRVGRHTVLPGGRIADDFRLLRRENHGQAPNAPSRAPTASLAIAEQVAPPAFR